MSNDICHGHLLLDEHNHREQIAEVTQMRAVNVEFLGIADNRPIHRDGFAKHTEPDKADYYATALLQDTKTTNGSTVIRRSISCRVRFPATCRAGFFFGLLDTARQAARVVHCCR